MQSRQLFVASCVCSCLFFFSPLVSFGGTQKTGDPQEAATETQRDVSKTVRFASYNISFNRRQAGQLKKDLATGDSAKPQQIAEVIQRVRPDVLLLCEFDHDAEGTGLQSFCDHYLAVGQQGAKPIEYRYRYFETVNTGVDSGIDLDGDGKKGTGNDAFGFGVFPGQYGMAVLSKYEIDTANVRTFQNFLWKDMPHALLPVSDSGAPYYSKEAIQVFRLSSKSHWDLPIKVGDKTIHFLTAHPTPPVFDGPEDKNGKRNHDEIRMFADYVSGKSDYLYDDAGVKGGLPAGAHFVVAGDLNADPVDGASRPQSIRQLLNLPNVNGDPVPSSKGGPYYAKQQGGANESHRGDPAFDTGDFNDRNAGNMRIDYCLPSTSLKVVGSGVYWPLPDQPGGGAVTASDHRLVWIDLEK